MTFIASSFFRITVPGLAESRPSVIVGDTILFRPSDDDSVSKWHQGVVHGVENTKVVLRFHDSFQVDRLLEGRSYMIQFTLNRLPFIRYHEAVGSKCPLDRILFPRMLSSASSRPVISAEPVPYFNRDISTNDKQMEVVARILHQPPGSSPFVIWGP